MSIVNLKRDGFWTTLKSTDEVAVATERQVNTETLYMSGDATVYDEFISARFQHTVAPTISANHFTSIGGYIRQPESETVPYRVKACANPTYQICAVGIGYAPATPTGTDDEIDPVAIFPFEDCFDELFMIPALDSGDSLYGRSLAFALICYYSAGFLSGGISVQRLATAPPQFSQSVS